jgi:hypothetical protein
MAFAVGTTSYISVADANSYLADQGLDQLDASQAEALLNQATKALDRRYGMRYLGTKTLSSQPLLWPRFTTSIDAYYNYNGYGDLTNWTSSTIPTEVKEATAELALMLSAEFDAYAAHEPAITEKTEAISGAINTTYKFASAFVDKDSNWTKIDIILGPVLGASRSASSNINMTRGA